MSLTRIKKYGFAHIDTGDDETARKFLTTLEGHVLAWADGEVKINADTRLTPDGKAAALRELGEKTMSELDAYINSPNNAATKSGARLQELRTRARKHEAKPSGDPATELRDREIRDGFRSMDALERLRELEEAIERGDADTYRAVMCDPRAKSDLLNNAIRKQVEHTWLRRHDSKLADAIELVNVLHNELTKAVTETRNGLAEAAGLDATLRERITTEAA